MKMTTLFKKLLFYVAMANAGLVLGQIAEEPRTPDGRAFSTLSKEEYKAQPVLERIAYNKWLKSKLDAEAKELHEDNVRKDKEIEKIQLRTLNQFNTLHLAGNKSPIYFDLKASFKKIILGEAKPYLPLVRQAIDADPKLKAAILE